MARTKGKAPLQSLTRPAIDNLLALGSANLAPILADKIAEVAGTFLLDLQAKYGHALSFDAVELDSDVVVIRRDSLHSLLRAAAQAKDISFRRAGAEAGVLFGVGLVKWFVSPERHGLPSGVDELLYACVRVDRASHWADLQMSPLRQSRQTGGFALSLTINGDFLAHELHEGAATEAADRYSRYRMFWAGYLEGAFSAALAAWYGEWARVQHVVPLFVAQCGDPEIGEDGDLHFSIEVAPPRYRSVIDHLQEKVLCPFLHRERSAATDARVVVEQFVRDLGEIAGGPGENIVAGLTWLAQHGPIPGRNAASYLQSTRNLLNTYHHDATLVSGEGLRSVIRQTAAAVFQANRDVQLTSDQVLQLRAALVSSDDR